MIPNKDDYQLGLPAYQNSNQELSIGCCMRDTVPIISYKINPHLPPRNVFLKEDHHQKRIKRNFNKTHGAHHLPLLSAAERV